MKIFCIGIGGIGISALARYYKHQGHDVSGSDQTDSELIHMLIKEGISVKIGTDSNNIVRGTDMVVYTVAIPTDHQELAYAKSIGITCKTYPEALGEITKEKKTIAVSGTHGKTTTTAMMYHALKECGINPTVIIGSLLSGVGTNFIPGDNDWMVVEACEYKRSFLNLHPIHVLVTNIDADHLDYYKDLDDIKSAFQSFVDKIPVYGCLVTHQDVTLKTVGESVNGDSVDKESIELSVFGDHNKLNAQLVIALIQKLGLDEIKARKGIKEFKGTWRRLEYKGKTSNGVVVYDDYGHHPTELNATFEALRSKYPKGEYTLHVFFQPHLYSRTKIFMDEFVKVLSKVDRVYIMPIYAAREIDDGTKSTTLVERINSSRGHAESIVSVSDLPLAIEAINDTKAIVVNIGAGDAYIQLNKIKFS